MFAPLAGLTAEYVLPNFHAQSTSAVAPVAETSYA